jgi:hypothetical protein
MGIKENSEFLHAIASVVGRPLTVAECYIAYALRYGKYKEMKDVPPLPKVDKRIVLDATKMCRPGDEPLA